MTSNRISPKPLWIQNKEFELEKKIEKLQKLLKYFTSFLKTLTDQKVMDKFVIFINGEFSSKDIKNILTEITGYIDSLNKEKNQLLDEWSNKQKRIEMLEEKHTQLLKKFDAEAIEKRNEHLKKNKQDSTQIIFKIKDIDEFNLVCKELKKEKEAYDDFIRGPVNLTNTCPTSGMIEYKSDEEEDFCAWFKRVEEKKRLLAEKKDLFDKQLSSEYSRITKQNTELLAELKELDGDLYSLRNELQKTKKNDPSMSVLLKAKSLAEKAERFLKHESSKQNKIIESYLNLESKFGLSCLNEKINFSEIMKEKIKSLKRELKYMQSFFEKYEKEIELAERSDIASELIVLFKSMITEKIPFWHQAVSVFGSRSEINNVSVPNGIAQIHTILTSNTASASKQLEQIKTIANDRLAAGTGFFARRDVKTAKLYEIISEIDVDRLAPRMFSQAKRKSREINGLSLISSGDKKTYAMKEFKR